MAENGPEEHELAGEEKEIFVGEYVHSLDPKKRLTIPSDWRELVGMSGQLFVLPGVNDKCLCVYPAREMTRRLQKFRKLSAADRKGRQLSRLLAARSDLIPWDVQGRIRIKDSLLEHAGIGKKVALVGSFDHFELWSPEQWKAEAKEVESLSGEDIAQFVGL